jgi:hypothetical protein
MTLTIDPSQFPITTTADHDPNVVTPDDMRTWGFETGRAIADELTIRTEGAARPFKRAWLRRAMQRLAAPADEFRKAGIVQPLIDTWRVAVTEGVAARLQEIKSADAVALPLRAAAAVEAELAD